MLCRLCLLKKIISFKLLLKKNPKTQLQLSCTKPSVCVKELECLSKSSTVFNTSFQHSQMTYFKLYVYLCYIPYTDSLRM